MKGVNVALSVVTYARVFVLRQASVEGGAVVGGGGRMVKGAQRPIQGGTGRRAMQNLAQLQEGVVQDSKDSPVEAVRAFIKRIAGKDQ